MSKDLLEPQANETLLEILDTTISPELVPASHDGRLQSTEEKIGPYDLHDFFVFYATRFGLRPSKIAFLAYHAWHDASAGGWPTGLPEEQRRSYDIAAIRRWLEIFLHRFFATSQFKRSALPNAPKVTTGGSLSPRGDWRAPSDGNARLWIKELLDNVPDAIADGMARADTHPLPGGKPVVR